MSNPTPNEIVKTLAAGLRDVLWESSESYIKTDPEEAFVDLACRLVLQLAKSAITILPQRYQAAARSLDILTKWIDQDRNRQVTIFSNSPSNFSVKLHTGTGSHFFDGESAQDALGQATQTIIFSDGGKL